MGLFDSDDPRDLTEYLADRIATGEARRNHVPDGDLRIDAKPTVYRGTTFRSALEASWAASLDNHGVAWDYEPTTVTLPSGIRYIPDFHLPEIGTWLEVKGDGVPRVEKAFEYARSLACGCPLLRCACRWPGGELVIIGRPPLTRRDRNGLGYALRRTYSLDWTSGRRRAAWLGRCADCRHVGWFDSGKCRPCGGPLIGSHGHRPVDGAFAFTPIAGPVDPVEKPEAA